MEELEDGMEEEDRWGGWKDELEEDERLLLLDWETNCLFAVDFVSNFRLVALLGVQPDVFALALWLTTGGLKAFELADEDSELFPAFGMPFSLTKSLITSIKKLPYCTDLILGTSGAIAANSEVDWGLFFSHRQYSGIWHKALIKTYKESEIPSGTCAAYSPMNHFVYCGNRKGEINIYDMRAQKKLQKFTAHESSVTAVALDSDESFFATGSSEGNIKIWNLKTLEPIQIYHHEHSKSSLIRNLNSGVNQLYFTNDNQLLSCGTDGTLVIRNLPAHP